MTGDGGLVEVQATAERTPLSRAHLDELLALAARGIEELRAAQDKRSRRPRAGRSRARRRRAREIGVRAVKLVLATRNAHKRREFARLLAGSERT